MANKVASFGIICFHLINSLLNEYISFVGLLPKCACVFLFINLTDILDSIKIAGLTFSKHFGEWDTENLLWWGFWKKLLQNVPPPPPKKKRMSTDTCSETLWVCRLRWRTIPKNICPIFYNMPFWQRMCLFPLIVWCISLSVLAYFICFCCKFSMTLKLSPSSLPDRVRK